MQGHNRSQIFPDGKQLEPHLNKKRTNNNYEQEASVETEKIANMFEDSFGQKGVKPTKLERLEPGVD